MSSQILKERIPNDILFDILKKIFSYEHEKYYMVDSISYKKAQFFDLLTSFLSEIEPYYYASKRYYLTRDMNYPRFITILRQLCKKNKINYQSKIKYSNSKYEIYYYIYKQSSVGCDATVQKD